MGAAEFLPDLGTHFIENQFVMKEYAFMGVVVAEIGQCGDDLFSVFTSQTWEGRKFAISLDMSLEKFIQILEAAEELPVGIIHEPGDTFHVFAPPLMISVKCHLGEQVKGMTDSFHPFIVDSVEQIR
jgi:hypothetical protein